jgi:hypothetical protein
MRFSSLQRIGAATTLPWLGQQIKGVDICVIIAQHDAMRNAA